MAREIQIKIQDLLGGCHGKQTRFLNYILFSLRLIVLLSILHFISDSTIKLVILLFYLLVFFQPFTKFEIVLFTLINILYFVMDAGAIQLGYLAFKQQQILGMPYYELLMWGTYYLITYRFLMHLKVPKSKGFLWFSFILFLLAFNGISNDMIRTVFCISILLISLYFSFQPDILKFVFIFLTIGVLVEFIGVIDYEWFYPREEAMVIPIWSYIVWIASGFYFYHFLAFMHYILSMRKVYAYIKEHG